MSLNGTGMRLSTVKIGRPPTINTLRVGATTQRFFEEGEQHEAAEWTDTVLPPDDAPEKDPDKQFDSFDKIPKKRSPSVTIAAIGACLLVGIAAWAMAFGILRRGQSVQESTRALTGAAAAPSDTVSAAAPAEPSGETTVPTNPGTQVAPAPAGTTPATTAPESGETAPGTAPPAGPLVVPMAPNSPTTPAPIAGSKTAAALAGSPRAAGRRPATSVIEIASTAPVAGATVAPTTLATDTGAPRGLGTDTRLLGGESEAAAMAPGGMAPGSAETSGAAANLRPSRSPDEGATDRSTSGSSSAEARDDRTPPLRGYVWSPSAKALVPADRALPTTDPDFATRASASTSGAPSGTSSSSSAPKVAAPVAPTSPFGGGAAAPATTGSAPAERPAPVGGGAQIEPPAFSPR